MLDMLNLPQYLEMRREAFKNDNTTMTAANAPDYLVWDTTKYTDWQEKLIGNTANMLNAQTSISGGNDNTQFLIAGGYQKETTVFPGDFSDQKISGHFNINHSSNDQKFKVVLSTIYLSEANKLFNKDLTSFLTYVPNTPDQLDASVIYYSQVA
jgi:hypothetical protein